MGIISFRLPAYFPGKESPDFIALFKQLGQQDLLPGPHIIHPVFNGGICLHVIFHGGCQHKEAHSAAAGTAHPAGDVQIPFFFAFPGAWSRISQMVHKHLYFLIHPGKGSPGIAFAQVRVWAQGLRCRRKEVKMQTGRDGPARFTMRSSAQHHKARNTGKKSFHQRYSVKKGCRTGDSRNAYNRMNYRNFMVSRT